MRGAHGRLSKAFLMMALMLLAGCERSYQAMAQERAEYAARAQGPIFVAVIEDHIPNRRNYVRGVQLAVDEINAAGGLLGRPLATQVFAGAATFNQALPTIRSIVANPRISAVLGHRASSMAVPASVVYEAAEALFLPAFATDPRLTLHNFKFVLRTLPDNQIMAAQSASVASLFGYETIAVLHARNDYSRELAFLFEDAARREGVRVVFRGSFFGRDINYRALIGRMNTVDFDAIYLSVGAEAGARMLRQLREMDMRQPVIGSDTLVSAALAEAVGAAGDRTIAPSIYAADNHTPQNRAFIAAYRAAFGDSPNRDAAQGYDSAHLFAEIVRQAGSTEPRVLSAKSHYISPFGGVSGIYAYDEHGDIYGKHYLFQILRGGRWRPLPGVTAPYLLAAFRNRLAQEMNEGEKLPESGANSAVPLQAVQMHQGAVRAIENGREGASERLGASTEIEGAKDADLLSGATLGDPRVGHLTRYRTWLAVAHATIKFQHLGLVISQNDQNDAFIGMVESVGEHLGFDVEVCRLSPPIEGAQFSEEALAEAAEQIQREALRCYSRLSVRIDAMLTPPNPRTPAAYLRRLNAGLRAYRVPAFILREALDQDYGLTLALVSAGANLQASSQAQRLEGMLKNLRVYDLNRRLAAMPAVLIDLNVLEDLEQSLNLSQLSIISGTFDFGAPEDPAAPAP